MLEIKKEIRIYRDIIIVSWITIILIVVFILQVPGVTIFDGILFQTQPFVMNIWKFVSIGIVIILIIVIIVCYLLKNKKIERLIEGDDSG